MQCDLAGLLLNSLDCPKRDKLRGYYEFSLRELIGNLRELKQRTDAGDMSAVKEFFDIYVVEGAEHASK